VAERKIIIAGDPPPRRVSWLRILLAGVAGLAIVAAGLALHERERAQQNGRGLARVRLFEAHLENARALARLADCRRPRPDRPLTRSESAALLFGGAPVDETIEAYRLSKPYEGPSEADLEAEIAGHNAGLDELYARSSGLGLARDDLDRWICARAPTATSATAPDLRASVNAHRARTGLPPM
jgi:hypothetical protein